jgi:hypothetical protein
LVGGQVSSRVRVRKGTTIIESKSEIIRFLTGPPTVVFGTSGAHIVQFAEATLGITLCFPHSRDNRRATTMSWSASASDQCCDRFVFLDLDVRATSIFM